MKPLVQPQINLNGSSGQSLVNDQIQVLQALDALERHLVAASPHGRDYQTLPKGSFVQASAAWIERIDMVAHLKREIEEYTRAIDSQRLARQRRA